MGKKESGISVCVDTEGKLNKQDVDDEKSCKNTVICRLLAVSLLNNSQPPQISV